MTEFSPAVQKQKKRVFVSAATPDLDNVRQVILEALWDCGCELVVVPDHPRYWRTADRLLRDTLASCNTFIHVAGMAYGGEPELPTKPPGETRQSFAQLEHHIGSQLIEDPHAQLSEVHVLIAPEDFAYDPLPKAEPEILQDLQRQHRQSLEAGPGTQVLPPTNEEITALVRSWFFEPPLPDCAVKIEEKAPTAKTARSSLKILEGVLAILVGLGVIGWGAMKLTGSKETATAQAATAAPAVAAVPADQLLPAYMERFRLWRMVLPTLSNVEIAQLVNRDLAAKFEVSSADIDQSITVGVAPLAASGTPLALRMPALFVLGRYQSLDELTRLQQAALDAAGWQVAGDAAVALNDDKPMTTYQDRAIQCYEKAATAFKDSSLENWAECQRNQALFIQSQGRSAEALQIIEATLAVQKEKKSGSLGFTLLRLADLLPSSNAPLIRATVQEAEVHFQAQDPAHKAVLALCPMYRSQRGSDRENFLRAESDLRESLRRLQEQFGPDHSALSPVLIRLAYRLSYPSIYTMTAEDGELYFGRFSEVMQKSQADEAERLLYQLLSITERSRGVTHPRMVDPLYRMAVLMSRQKRHADAEPFIMRRLSINEATYGRAHNQTQLSRLDQAILWVVLKREKEAEPILHEVLRHFDAQPAVRDFDMRTVLTGLSTALIQQNRHPEALPLIRRLITIMERLHGQTGPELISPLCDLAHAAYLTYGFSEGEQAGKRAMQLCLRHNYLNSDTHPDTVTAIKVYGLNSIRNGQSLEKTRAVMANMAFDAGLPAEKSEPWIREAVDGR